MRVRDLIGATAALAVIVVANVTAGILLLIAAARRGNVVVPRWSGRHARSPVEARAAQ